MTAQPTGTVTLLFSDIEGSTRLLEALGHDQYADVLDLHRDILRRAFTEQGGYEVDYEGDAFFVSFSSAAAATTAAVAAQRALAGAEWPRGLPLRVRMGLHTGEPLALPPKYVGLDVHRAARIMAAGHGGQVLLSEQTASFVFERLPEGTSLVDLGEHRLRDLSSPHRLYQLTIADLPSGFPPLATIANRPTNLPAPPNQLVGRETELESLVQMLRSRTTRVLTLTGPGGTGKTRLALHAGAELIDDFADGVFVVFLAPVRDPLLLPSATAQALGLAEQPGETVEQTVEQYLFDREILLVLDNVEHLLDAAPTLAMWVASAPRLTILTTSREPIRVGAESCFDVPPLPTPTNQPESALEALSNDAIALFVERAKAADREFELADTNVPTVAEICRRLDGLPLALELAAARVRTLSAESLLRRLDSALKILTSGQRDADARQSTLEAAIEWSYKLLETEERAVFRRLATFAGGCTVSAAETVCEASLDTLQSLVEKSLIRRQGERLLMLATIRSYAQLRLDESGEADEFGWRHANFFLELAQQRGRELHSEAPTNALASLDAEIANLRAALNWLRLHGEVRLELRLLGSLERFWTTHGHVREGWAALRDALGRRPQQASSDLLIGLRAGVWLAEEVGEHELSETLSAERVAAARHLGVHDEVIHGLCGLAIARLDRHDVTGALSLFEESAVLARQTGNAACIAPAVGNLAEALLINGESARSRELSEEALEHARMLGDARWVAGSLNNLAWALVREGFIDDADDRFREALGLASRLSGTEYPSFLEGLAAIALARKDPLRASTLLGAAESFRLSEGLVRPWYTEERLGRVRAAASRELGADAFANALANGRRLSIAEAVDVALERSLVPEDD
jgi:predicted ATPase/class 3 adenylate cyclase